MSKLLMGRAVDFYGKPSRMSNKIIVIIPKEFHKEFEKVLGQAYEVPRRRGHGLTTSVVNVRDYEPYSSYWYNQPSDSQYVYIGRAGRRHPIPESKWHNPFRLKDPKDMAKRLEVIRLYREEHLPRFRIIRPDTRVRGIRF